MLMLIRFFFVLFTLKLLHASIDTSHVQTSFDQRGLPVFKSDVHSLNWFLDVSQCEHLALENTRDHDVEVTIQLKVFNAEAVTEDFEEMDYEDINEDGSLQLKSKSTSLKNFFNEIKNTAKRLFKEIFKKTLKAKIRSFNCRQGKILIKPHETYVFRGSRLVTVRAVRTQDQILFTYNSRKIEGKIGKKGSPDIIQENMQKLIMEEFLDAGKRSFNSDKTYEFPDWNALTINESTFGAHRNFLQTFYKEAKLSLSDVAQKRAGIIEKSKNILAAALKDTTLPSQPLIPLIMHKVWITSNDTPYEIPEDRLEHYVKESQKLKEFRHIVWVMDAQKIPKSVKYLKNKGHIEIRELKEIWPEFRGKAVFNRLYKNNRFVACSDITRMNVVYLFGGVYADFGVEFQVSPTLLCHYYTSFTLRESYLLSGTSMGFTPKHVVPDKVLEFLDNINRVPHEYRNIADNCPIVAWVAYGIITAMFDLYVDENERYIPIPFFKAFVTINHMCSWGGKNSCFGNKGVSKEGISDNEYFGNEIIGTKEKSSLNKKYPLLLAREILRIFFHQKTEDVEQKRNKLIQSCKDTYYQLIPTKVNLIPHISHRIWLTDSEKPCEPPLGMLENYVNSLRQLNVSHQWRHFFWCVDPLKIPKTIAFLKAANVGIEVHTVNEIYPNMRCQHLYNLYKNNNMNVQASDVLRINIVNTHGGIYSDLGANFERDLTPLIDSYELFCRANVSGLIDHNVLATPPSHPLLQKWFSIVDALKDLPQEARNITPTTKEQIEWTAGGMWHALFYSYLSPDAKVLFTTDGLIKHNGMESWHRKGSLGNTGVEAANIQVFD